MSTIVTRAGKGSPLTNTEVDSNFTNLNTDKLESGGALGTPASGTLTNCTGLPTAGLVDNAVTNAKLRDSDGLSVIGRGANSTGDPADIVAGTNHQVLRRDGSSLAFGAVDLSSNQAVTGTLPVNQGGTGITSLGSGVATFLGTPSSANLAAAVTDETGSGALVFATSPTLVTPALGTPSSGTLTNATGLPIDAGTTGTLPVARGGTGTATPALVQGANVTITGTWPNQTIAATGGGGTVTSVGGTGTVNGITLTGTVTSSGNLTLGGTLSGVSLTTQVTGTLPAANGGTGLSALGTAGQALVVNSGATALEYADLGGGSPTAVTYTFTGPVDPIGSIILSAPMPVQIGSTVEAVTGAFATIINFANVSATEISFTNLQGIASSFAPPVMPALTTLSFTALTGVGLNFSPANMPALTTLSCPALKSVGATFGPNNMASLTTLTLTALTSVGTAFNPNNMAALTTLSCPALTSVGVLFAPNTMAALTTLSCPALTSVVGNFNPTSMASLTTFTFSALTSVTGIFNPGGMAALTTLSCPALTSVGGNFQPFGVAALTTFDFPALTSVGGLFTPPAMTSLTTLSLPALTSIGGIFNPPTLPALTSISMPAIVTFGGTITSGNAVQLSVNTSALTTFEFPSTLLRVGNGAGNVVITSAALNQTSVDSILIRLAALDGTSGTTTFDNRIVTITGTSATPSATGLIAKATLVARGCTVTNN